MSRAVETPIAGVLLSRAGTVPDGVSETLAAGPIHPVPRVSDPITHESVRPAYDKITEIWANA
jgi:hypothetical protein